MSDAFQKTKELFLEAIMLRHPLPNKRYFIATDSSGFAIGAHLFQLDGSNDKRVIAFASKVLSSAQKQYGVTERECLAIVFALQKWRTYVLGTSLTIISDHKSLSFMLK